jgi:hypothetical protein
MERMIGPKRSLWMHVATFLQISVSAELNVQSIVLEELVKRELITDFERKSHLINPMLEPTQQMIEMTEELFEIEIWILGGVRPTPPQYLKAELGQRLYLT